VFEALLRQLTPAAEDVGGARRAVAMSHVPARKEYKKDARTDATNQNM
jgi:hypothetical protein